MRKLLHFIGGNIYLFLQRVDERPPGPAQGEAIFPAYVETELTSLPQIHCYPPMGIHGVTMQ